MLEDIQTSQMERIQIRGQWIKNYDHVVPHVIKEIVDKLYARASSWRATWNEEASYQVSGPSEHAGFYLLVQTVAARQNPVDKSYSKPWLLVSMS